MDTDEMVMHIRSITDRAIKLQDVVARAERGLRFSKARLEEVRGFEDERYWQGKVDAYQVIVEEAQP